MTSLAGSDAEGTMAIRRIGLLDDVDKELG